jgi:hypothetical protein
MPSEKPDLTLTGIVHAIPPARVFNDKTYPEIVLEIDPGKYPQHPKLECRDSLASLVANLQIGSEVRAHFNVRGREYTNKKTGAPDWFTSIQVWKIDILSRGAEHDIAPSGGGGDDSDIPF